MAIYKTVQTGGMSESCYGISTLEKMKEEGLGNYTVLFCGPWDNNKLKQVVEFCETSNYRFVMDEMVDRLTGEFTAGYQALDMGELRQTLDQAGAFFDGSLFMCEFGGLMLYWPEDYVKGSVNVIPDYADFADAEAFMIKRLKEIIDAAEKKGVKAPLICIEASGGVSKHLYKAGIDRVDLEVTYSPYNEFFYSTVKGATLAYDKPAFGTDMAMVWYGGNQHDKLWQKRWRTSLYHAFIRGADPIYAEHGIMDYKALGKDLPTDSEDVKGFRDGLAELAKLAENHPRPVGMPKSRIAVVHGNLDSFAGLGQTHAWGQRHNDNMKIGPAEASWNLFDTFYEKNPWEFRYQCGDHDYSGNPPLGQVDVIPAESPLNVMKNYDCLIFLGWNTMTQELYQKLKDYVEHGGHLLCSLSHLNTSSSYDGRFSMINEGDLRDLFGVTINIDKKTEINGIKFKENSFANQYPFPLWSAVCDPKYMGNGFSAASLTIDSAEIIAAASSSFPDKWEEMNDVAISGNSCGKGAAFLVNSLEYPGASGLSNLYKDLLRIWNMTWHKDLMVECSDRIRYNVYEENGMYILYLLNTEAHLNQEALISCGENKDVPVTLKPGELRAVYCSNSIMAIPDNIHDRITSLKDQNGNVNYETYKNQQGDIKLFLDGQ